MQLIPCPWCGPRDEPEFAYVAEPVARPPHGSTDAEWSEYLYLRGNEKGPHREVWRHAGGCGQWFVLERDTVTHAVTP